MRPRCRGLGQSLQRSFWHSPGCCVANRTILYQPSAAEESEQSVKAALQERTVLWGGLRRDAKKRGGLNNNIDVRDVIFSVLGTHR